MHSHAHVMPQYTKSLKDFDTGGLLITGASSLLLESAV